jgi:hypothetical protein
MRPALDTAGHRVPRTKPTCLLHTWSPHRQRPFALVLHLHQHESSRNQHLQYLAKNQSTQRCQSLITQGSDHPPVLEPHMVLTLDLPNHSTDCSKTSGIAGLPPRQPLPQRNRPETLTIKRNRRNRFSRSRTRPTRETTKSSPIHRRYGGKVTSQRGTRTSYVTPTKNPKKSSSKHRQQKAPKINTKETGKPP